MKEKYKSSQEQRERMLSYYYKNRERILEYQRQQREREKHKLKHYPNLIEMYQDWSLSLIEKLETKKLPSWIRVGIIRMIMQLNDRLNELEQYEPIRKTKLER